MARAAGRFRRVGLDDGVVMVVDPGLRHLRRAVRRGRRPALARVRARHGVPVKARQRRHLSRRFVHAFPRSDRVALVALPPSHRHDHRRARRRDRLPTTAERAQDDLDVHPHRGRADDVLASRQARLRTDRCRCRRVRARERAPQDRVGVAGDGGDRGRRRGMEPRGVVAAADPVHRRTVDLRGVADGVLRHHATCRAAREHARSQVQHAHGVHEPGLPVPVSQHELPRRASPVPERPLPGVAQAARRDQVAAGAATAERARHLQAGLPRAVVDATQGPDVGAVARRTRDPQRIPPPDRRRREQLGARRSRLRLRRRRRPRRGRDATHRRRRPHIRAVPAERRRVRARRRAVHPCQGPSCRRRHRRRPDRMPEAQRPLRCPYRGARRASRCARRCACIRSGA